MDILKQIALAFFHLFGSIFFVIFDFFKKIILFVFSPFIKLKKYLIILKQKKKLNKKFQNKSYHGIEETMNTTMAGLDPEISGAANYYTIATLTDFLRVEPQSAFAHYMIAELYLDNGDITKARKEFMIGQKMEAKFPEQILTNEEKKLKKKAKAKVEKRLGYKLVK